MALFLRSNGKKGESGREGFALLITLSVLAVLIALSAVMVSMMDRARSEANAAKALVQANVLYRDAARVLDKTKKNEEYRAMLLASPLPIGDPQKGMSVIVSCKPEIDTVNLNWWGLDDNATYQAYAEAAKRMMRAVIMRYELENGNMLEEMLDAHFEAKKGRNAHRFLSFSEFYELLVTYILRTGDEKVRDVPWKTLFVFEPVEKVRPEKIAVDYMDPKAAALFFGLDESLLKENALENGTSMKEFIAASGFLSEKDDEILKEGQPSSLVCEVDFRYRDKPYAFRFYEYEGKVNRFVFLDEQK
jgi:hypothetical protein